MGLDTTHDAWSGAYSSFNRWRDSIAFLAGYPIRGDLFNTNEVEGKWIKTPPDALTVLMNHSDCDGVIQVAQLQPLLNRLLEIRPLVTDAWMVEKTDQFIAGLRDAIEAKEDIEFH